jgi:hypothetical protein
MSWLRDAVVAGGLLLVVALLAWVTGEPVVFPSLGPTAYVLAVAPDRETSQPRRVLGGHAIGVVAGFLAYHALAPGLTVPASLDPASLAGARLAASAVVSVTLTAGAMLATDLRHAPACATTLIVALGLLPTLRQAALIALAVAVLVGVHRGLRKAAPAQSSAAPAD